MKILIPMLGCFKDFRCARIILGGIETMHVIAKGQMKSLRRTPLSAPHSNSISWFHKTAHPPAGFVQPRFLIATKPLVRGFEGQAGLLGAIRVDPR